MQIKKMAATVLALLVPAAFTWAQKQWTLDECLDYALANNLQLKQGQITKEQNAAALEQQKAALFPTLSFSTNQNASWRPWNQSFVNLTGGTLTSTSSEVNYNGSYGLNAGWTVWNGGRNQKNIDKSKVAYEQSDYEWEQTANSIQEQIAQYFVQIMYQTEAVKVNQQILEASKLQRDRAKTMVEVGNLARVDLSQLEAQVSQDEYNVVSAQTQLENYKLQLKQLLELVGTESFDICIPDIDDNNILAPIPSKQEVFEAALSSRPEIQSGRLNIKSSELDIDIAKRGYYPTLSMSAGIGTSNTSGIHTDLSQQWKNNLNNSLGLTLSIPILDNKQNRTNVRRAKLSKESSELSLKTAEKELYSQIEAYWLNANSSQHQYTAARANVASMQESYDLVSEQFRLGLKNIVELTTGKNNLLQAQQQLLQSKYVALLNVAMLRFYKGERIRL